MTYESSLRFALLHIAPIRAPKVGRATDQTHPGGQIVGAVRESGEVRPFVAELKAINCHHNYVARERQVRQPDRRRQHQPRRCYSTRGGTTPGFAKSQGLQERRRRRQGD